MLPILTVFFAFFAAYVTAFSHEIPISNLAKRQSSAPPTDCNATCSAFTAVKKSCNYANCGCTVRFLQAQGECLLCQTDTPEDAAAVQFMMNAEMNQCHFDGISIDLQIQLPPAATAIVEKFNSDSSQLRQQQTAFLALQVAGGHFGLVIVLLFAVFSSKVQRDLTFFNFCVTWIFSSIAFSIQLYRGTDEDNTLLSPLGIVQPNSCLAQAGLTSGAQVMTACSTMVLVIQLWLSFRASIYGAVISGPKRTQSLRITLLVAPYVLFLAFAIPATFVGQQPLPLDDLENLDNSGLIVNGATFSTRVLPTNFYCTVELDAFVRTVYAVTLGFLIITVFFDALIISTLYRHWRAFRTFQTKSSMSLSTLMRVIVFSVFRVAVAIAYGTVLGNPFTIRLVQTGGLELQLDVLSADYAVPRWVDMLQATIPLVAFFVLGVNRDMISTLLFWRKKRYGINRVDGTWNEKKSLEVT